MLLFRRKVDIIGSVRPRVVNYGLEERILDVDEATLNEIIISD